MNRELETLRRGLDKGLIGLDSRATQARTNGDAARWSVQQIVDHLLMTYSLSSEVFAKRLEKGTPTRAPVTMMNRMAQFVVLTLGRFPAGRPAPPNVIPVESDPVSGPELAQRIKKALELFDGLAVEAERAFGDKRAIAHQILGPLSVAQWRRFHRIHGEHHLKQIRALRP